MFRVAVLGTSNAILKNGYYTYLKQNTKFNIDRYSIGDTTSMSGVYNILTYDIYKYEYAIIDFNLNEIKFMVEKNYPPEWCVSTFIYLLGKLIEHDVIPIVLGLWHEDYSHLPSYQEEICRKYNITFIDMRYLEAFGKNLYSDKAHYIPEFQSLIAEKIITAIYDSDISKIKKIDLEELEFSLLSQKINFSLKSVDFFRRKNSLLEKNLYKLNKNSSILVHQDDILCGVAYWSDQNTTNSTTIKYENNKIVKNLRISHDGFIVRSIGFRSEIKNFEIILDGSKQYNEETVNSVDRKGIYFCINDLIFANKNLNECGKNFIIRDNINQIIIIYKFIHCLKSKNLLKAKEYLNNIKIDNQLYKSFLLYEEKKYDECIKELNLYEPELLWVKYYTLAKSYQKLNIADEAINNYKKSLSYNTSHLDILLEYSIYLDKNKKYNEAISFLELSNFINKNWKGGLKRLSIIYNKIGNRNMAIKTAKLLCDIDDTNRDWLSYLEK